MKVLNSFSIQMLGTFPATVSFQELTETPALASLESFIGHADTANVLGVAFNRQNTTLAIGETFLIAQLMGGRLPEGSVVLPEGFFFRFFLGVVS